MAACTSVIDLLRTSIGSISGSTSLPSSPTGIGNPTAGGGGVPNCEALKGNQETLHQAVIEHIDEQLEGDLARAQEHVTTENGHGREEKRTYLQLPAPEGLPGFGEWKGLKSIGVVTSAACVRGRRPSRSATTSAVWRWT